MPAPNLSMHISQNSLRRANPKNVIRLAHYAGVVMLGRTIEEIIEELHLKINYAHLGF